MESLYVALIVLCIFVLCVALVCYKVAVKTIAGDLEAEDPPSLYQNALEQVSIKLNNLEREVYGPGETSSDCSSLNPSSFCCSKCQAQIGRKRSDDKIKIAKDLETIKEELTYEKIAQNAVKY